MTDNMQQPQADTAIRRSREFITVERQLWRSLADLVQDMGRVHPSYRGTPTGDDLATLGAAIRYCIEEREPQLRAEAEAVITKHGYDLEATTLVGRCIETANRLLGLPAGLALG
ncbi:hypothetical protein ACUXLG_005838 [Ralstonia sp. 121560039-2]|jgi:hypothetical protein|nr:hypothetical protein [Ralstonia insidiosa]MBA9940416.1 hypothetical protein [Ralstonia insidiosa]